jgi:hypothetical protein
MNRLGEVERKHVRLRDLLERRGAGSLWLRRTRNLSWITAGAEVAIATDSENAPYSVLITPEKRTIITDNIELPRLRKRSASKISASSLPSRTGTPAICHLCRTASPIKRRI